MNDSIIEHNGYHFKVRVIADEHMGPPWEEHDGHGVISAVKRHRFGMGTKPPKRAGERILYWEGGDYRTYDFAATMVIAKRDGWDAPPYKTGTKGQTAARAVEADFRHMQGWCEGRWYWVGVEVSLVDEYGDDMGEPSQSLWGMESDDDEGLQEAARELGAQIIDALTQKLAA